ncbi:DNA-binding response regulator [Nocardioides marmoriginsengisoli]|uniref:DNA-binding response regulator n=1 Tax=Nocardioides marmoriginsengisoli TaxID=661483 RepID=A0A3N0CBN4_9ACTN|nr:response regulator transcription factor [Nocardioides marmoriginsengisoli]RNL60852.1 DNA-binding response regulator [Nocardioides marmoriginsengisoli]
MNARDGRGGASAPGAEVRVVLVDDQELVRSGLRRILRKRDGFDIVAECGDGAEVPDALASAGDVDVVVMDLRMREIDGITATRALAAEPDAPPVLVLTTFDDDEMLSGALRAGAAGFLLKDSSAEDLIRAVRAVAAGDSWLDPAVTGRVLNSYRQSAPVSHASGDVREILTARELEVLCAMAGGRSNAEIAEDLFISELTVKSHIGRIFTKLDLRDRPAAIVYAYDNGLVHPA